MISHFQAGGTLSLYICIHFFALYAQGYVKNCHSLWTVVMLLLQAKLKSEQKVSYQLHISSVFSSIARGGTEEAEGSNFPKG